MRGPALAARMPRGPVRVRAAARSPSPHPRVALARPSSRGGTGLLPSPTSAGVERMMRADRARRPRWPACRSLGALEMARVIDARHHKPPIALSDHRDGGVLDPEREQAMVRRPDDPRQCDLDDSAVGHDQDVPVIVPREDRVHLTNPPGFKRRGALPAGNHIPAWLLSPPRPGVRESLRQLIGVEPLPVAEIDLPQARRRAGRAASRGADQLGGLERALEVARVEPGKTATSQPSPHAHRLPATFLRQWGVDLTLAAVLAIPGRLAAANQQQSPRPSFRAETGLCPLRPRQ